MRVSELGRLWPQASVGDAANCAGGAGKACSGDPLEEGRSSSRSHTMLDVAVPYLMVRVAARAEGVGGYRYADQSLKAVAVAASSSACQLR